MEDYLKQLPSCLFIRIHHLCDHGRNWAKSIKVCEHPLISLLLLWCSGDVVMEPDGRQRNISLCCNKNCMLDETEK